MNQHTTFDDFGYRDFILIKASRENVEAALRTHVLEHDVDLDFEVQPWRPGLLMRLVFRLLGQGKRIEAAVAETQRAADAMNAKRAAADPVDTDAASRHTGAAAAAADMTTTRGPAYGPPSEAMPFDPFQNDVRLSGIEGSDWLLVEYKEQVSGMSMLGFHLSMSLAGVDVLFFRQSGSRASEAHHDFHVYRDGNTQRRVLCHATWPHGDPAQEWWEGQSDGALSGYETEALYKDATERTLLDNAGIESILAGLSLSSAALFGSPAATADPVLFSRRAGGTALIQGAP